MCGDGADSEAQDSEALGHGDDERLAVVAHRLAAQEVEVLHGHGEENDVHT